MLAHPHQTTIKPQWHCVVGRETPETTETRKLGSLLTDLSLSDFFCSEEKREKKIGCAGSAMAGWDRRVAIDVITSTFNVIITTDQRLGSGRRGRESFSERVGQQNAAFRRVLEESSWQQSGLEDEWWSCDGSQICQTLTPQSHCASCYILLFQQNLVHHKVSIFWGCNIGFMRAVWVVGLVTQQNMFHSVFNIPKVLSDLETF